MNDEILARANALQQCIKNAKQNLSLWEQTTGYSSGNLSVKLNSNDYSQVPLSFVPFIVVKALAVEGFRNELADLEKQYAEL